MASQRAKITPIFFNEAVETDKNDVYLSLDEVIQKRGIHRVPKSYEKRCAINDPEKVVEAIKARMKNNPERDDPDEEEVMGVECYNLTNVKENKRNLEAMSAEEDELMDFALLQSEEINDSKRLKVIYDDLEQIPEEEDDDIKDIIFGPMSTAPSKKVASIAVASTSKSSILAPKTITSFNLEGLPPVKKTISFSSTNPFTESSKKLDVSISPKTTFAIVVSEGKDVKIAKPIAKKNPFLAL